MCTISNFSHRVVNLVPSGEWLPREGLWYIVRVIEGRGFWISKNASFEVVPGTVLISHGNAGCRLMASRDLGLCFEWVVVKTNLLTSILSINERRAFEELASSGQSTIQLPPGDELASRCAHMMAEVTSLDLLTRIRLLELMFTVLVPKTKPRRVVEGDEDSRTRFRALLARIPESELMSNTIEELAANAGCSIRHFSRLFTEELGMSFRERQTELRLVRAQELLAQSNSKIIDIAHESGYQHLGLFNSLFRRRFGMTPSAWRRQSQKPTSRKMPRNKPSSLSLTVAAALLGGGFLAAQDNSSTPSAAPASPILAKAMKTNAPPIRVIRDFTVEGNTILPQEAVTLVLSDFRGLPITTNNVTAAVKALQLVYQGRGYPTVLISVPRQNITNGVVHLDVVEAPLSEILVKGNHWFSEGNIRRSLPDLHTNILLNSKIFKQELDQANNNQDRQIYPLIQAGTKPGTTRLLLNVKDQLPVHGRFELNNQYTPGTPELRGNASVQYNNLWQREHAIGLQYGFALQEFKAPESSSLIDRPLIANYSGYYRLPLSSDEPIQPAIEANPRKFGYNEATRQFVLPPSQGRTDLTIYANRSTTDTGVKVSPVETVNPAPIGLYSQASGQDVSTTEAVGFRISKPLPEFLAIRSSMSLGADLKNFQRASFNTNDFLEEFSFLNPDTNQTQTNSLPFSNTQPPRTANVSYLPIAIRWDAARSDTNGTTTFGAGLNFNFAGGPFSDRQDFINTAGTTNATGTYVTLLASASRQQKLPADWTLLMKADGQWANEPLISNEQLGMGGLSGVRGYLEGERFGDTGWRFTLEPRTPMVDIGMVDGTMPLRFQGAFFMDYGRSYSLNPNSSVNLQTLWGAGMGVNAKIGTTLDFRAAVAWALRDAQTTHAGAMQVYFAVAAQF